MAVFVADQKALALKRFRNSPVIMARTDFVLKGLRQDVVHGSILSFVSKACPTLNSFRYRFEKVVRPRVHRLKATSTVCLNECTNPLNTFLCINRANRSSFREPVIERAFGCGLGCALRPSRDARLGR